MVDVVGLRFITEGEAKAIRALDMYRSGLDRTSEHQRKYASQMNSAVQRELQAVRNLMQMRQRAAREQEQAVTHAERAIAKQDAAERRSLQQYLRYQQEKERAAMAQARAQEQAAAKAASATAKQDATERRSLQQYLRYQQEKERAAMAQARAQEQAAAKAASAAAKQDATERRSLQQYLRYQQEKERAATAQARAEEQAAAKAASAIAKQDAAERRSLQQYLRYQQEKERAATAQARAQEQAAQEEMRAAQQVVQSYARLQASVNPAVAAQQRLKQAHDTVRAALAAEIITREEAAQTLREYRAQTQAAGTASAFTGRNISRSGVLTQQAGYQIGDFLVQVQSGTNALVAFGQQATQVAGTLTLLGGRWILIGSILGVAIPLITAVGAAWMRTRGEAEKTTDVFADLSKTLSDIDATSIERITGGLETGAREAAQEWRVLLNIMREVAQEDLRQQLDKIMQAPLDALVAARARTSLTAQIGGQVPQLDVLGFSDETSAVQAIQLLRGVTGDTREEIAESLRMTELWLRGSGLLTDEVKQLLVQLATAADVQSVIKATIEDEVKGTQKIDEAARARLDAEIEAWQAAEDAYSARVKNANERIAQYEREIALSEAILAHGQDSAKVEVIRRQQAMALVAAHIEQEGLTGEIAQRMLDAAAAAYDTDAAVAAASGSAKGLSSALRDAVSAMGALTSFSAGLDRSLAVAAAKVDALRTGANEAVAGQIAGARADLERRTNAAVAAGADRSDTEILYAAGLGQISQLEALENERVRLQEAGRSGASGSGSAGGGAAAADLQTILSDNLKRIEQERELLGLFGKARQEREIALGLEDQILKSGQTATQEQIAAAAAKIAAEERVNEALLRQTEILDTVGKTLESSLSSGLMSIVDGTKTAGDAFRDMSKQIIAELYKVLVVQRIVGSWDNKTGSGSGIVGAVVGAIGKFFAAGDAFSGGSTVPFARGAVMANLNHSPGARVIPFADGGVVGSPMVFPMSGGRTGLMGEAGPEAIMPLKRSSDGKLGVATSGAAPIVQIINQIPDAQITQESELQPNGATLERFSISRAVATGLTTSGGAGRKTLQQTFGVQPRRTTR